MKPNVPLPPQGFQTRPQGPPPSPRNSINNGSIGAPRPPGPPLRRLDSRSSLGPPPASGQFVQLRPYGPPRPPGGSFPPRSPQPGQLPPQNPLLPPNQRFVYSPGIRGSLPQGAGGQRPPFVVNQQAYQAQLQQQRSGNDPRFQRPDVAPSQNEPRRPSQESVFPRQLLRNDSLLSLQRQQLLSNEEIKQPTRPRIVIEKMADINETSVNLNKPENYLQRKNVRDNGENDDDDDVVMDNKKSPRHNGDGVPEGLVNGSKSPSIPRKVDDVSRPTSRPGTAVEDKREYMDKRNIPSRPISANIDDTATLISQNIPFSAVNNDKEQKPGEQLDGRLPSSKEINTASISGEIKKSSSPYNTRNTEQNLKTSLKSSDNSRSVTPTYLDTPQNAEQDRNPDRSRSSTPARLEPPGTRTAERESKSPVKPSDKLHSNTPADLESFGNAEQESKVEQMKESSRPASSLSLMSEKDGKSLKSPATPRNRDQLLISPKSPESTKGYDNGQQRSLSSSHNPRLPKSPVHNEKEIEDGKKKTSFVEDSITIEKTMEMANRTSTISKPTSLISKTPRMQTSAKSDDEKKAAEKKGCVLACKLYKTYPDLFTSQMLIKCYLHSLSS